METNIGCSITKFFPYSDPEGLCIVNKPNWIGRIVTFPRIHFSKATEREELKRCGVYILSGPSNDGILPNVYIGEGERVLDRLSRHEKTKDFWTRAVACTSLDETIDKSIAKWLEAEMLNQALETKRAIVKNSNSPGIPLISESSIAIAKTFFNTMMFCLPSIGIDFFENGRKEENSSNFFYLKIKREKESMGTYNTKGFLVHKGSFASKETTQVCSPYIVKNRNMLVEQGVLEDVGAYYKLTQDYLFNTPSSAATTLRGCDVNGWSVWKNKDGLSLKEAQDSKI